MENRAKTMWVRKIPQRNAFGGTDVRLWELCGIAAHTQFSRASRAHSTQVPPSGDNRSQDEQEQTCNRPLFGGERSSLRRLQGTGTTDRTASSAGHPNCSAGHCGFPGRSLSRAESSLFPFISGCSGPLKSHLSLMPGYRKILFPSYPGLASPHQLHFLIRTFKNENQTKTAFSHFSLSDFTLSFLGLWSAKSLCALNIPNI